MPAEECRVVYAHATGTIVGDAAESKAIDEVYAGGRAIVTSIKGHLGHSMASAGAMCAIAGITGMHEGRIPPTMGTQRVDPQTRFDLVTAQPRAPLVFGFSSQRLRLRGTERVAVSPIASARQGRCSANWKVERIRFYRGATPMNLLVKGTSGPLAGEVQVPNSKYHAHRALILASLAPGTSRILGLSDARHVRVHDGRVARARHEDRSRRSKRCW